jgi:large subunit ribosomal protein L3
MPRIRFPRHGSLMYWPRKRAKSMVARVRTWSTSKEPKLLGFGGYKVGMTHAIVTDNRPNSITKGEGIQCPITIIECPPLKVAGLVLYTKDAYGLHCVGCVLSSNLDKDLSRSIPFPKAAPKPVDQLKPEDYAEIRVLVHTQPKLTSSLNKKKPEMFELALGGSVKEKLEAARALLGKEVNAKDVLAEGTQFDTHSVTTGRGTQGPVKRFGVRIRHHKSE